MMIFNANNIDRLIFLSKYLIYGIINTLFGFFIYSAFIYMNFSYQLSVLVALLFGVVFSYFTHSSYVFKQTGSVAFIKYLILGIFLYFINLFLISIFLDFGFDAYYSGAFSSLILVVLSFLFQSKWIFKKRT